MPSTKQPSCPSYAWAARHGALLGALGASPIHQHSTPYPTSYLSQTSSSNGSCGSSPGIPHQQELPHRVLSRFWVHPQTGGVDPSLIVPGSKYSTPASSLWGSFLLPSTSALFPLTTGTDQLPLCWAGLAGLKVKAEELLELSAVSYTVQSIEAALTWS